MPADALAAWRQACAACGGLAAGFGAQAHEARWAEDVLEVAMPAESTSAIAFLRRAEVGTGIVRELTQLAGRPVRYAIKLSEAAARTPAEPQPARPKPAASQATLLREVAEHPLVVQARTLFDAAVCKVDASRPEAGPSTARSAAAAPAETAEEEAHDA